MESAAADNCKLAEDILQQGTLVSVESQAATDLYLKAAGLCDTLVEAKYNLGLSYYHRAKYSQAIAEFEKAIKLKELPDFYSALGNSFVKLKRYREAEKNYKRALELDARHLNSFTGLSAMYYEEGKLPQSKSTLEKAIGFYPAKGDLYFLLGAINEKNDKPFDAVTNYKMAIKKDGAQAKEYLALGRALVALDRHAEAEKAYQSANLLEPDNLEVLLNLASFYESLEKFDMAEKVFALAREVDDGSEEYLLLRGLYSYRRGNYDRGQALINKALKKYPRSSKAYNAAAWTYLLEGDLEKAEKTLNKSLKYDVKNAEAYNNLGLVYEAYGDTKQAIKHYKRAFSLDSNLQVAQDNLGRLQ